MAYNIDTSKATVPEALEVLADAVLNPKFQSWEVAEQVGGRRLAAPAGCSCLVALCHGPLAIAGGARGPALGDGRGRAVCCKMGSVSARCK